MAAAASAAVTQTKAGFWIRVVAFIIDSIIVGVINAIVAAILSSNTTGRTGIQTILGIIYFSYFWSASSPWPGQTVGDKLLNLRVIRTDGSDLTIVQAFIRYVGLFISFIVIFIGVIWVAFDPNKQGWHDKIAGTYVVKTV
ncbi:MAG: RDD family protein [Chloroflexota bacterium]|nr:MAG: RDD family protein [Chloroflexota bacterium]TMD87055.1 MAG: RDD family protein [Chloroflexota bacterium]